MGNKDMTRHVLANLIKNSLRAIKEADKGDISISLEKGRDYNKLIFRDTALGISKEFLEQLFEQFHTKTSADRGTGLGLAFCKMVMNGYGGDITCNAALGKYTEFVLTFPKIKK